VHAVATPDKPAVIMAGSGELLTFEELNDRSNQLAQLWYAAGLQRGDHVSILMENNIRYFEAYWAAVRSGLYFTTINRYLQPEETAYILQDSGSRSLITSAAMAEVVAPVPALAPGCEVLLTVDGPVDGFEPYEDVLAAHPAEQLESQPLGGVMLYSSGTTGRPRGIKRPLADIQIDDASAVSSVARLLRSLFHADADSVYLSPAPLYHSAPLGFTTSTQAIGGTVVVMEAFDPAQALAHLERYQITHSQWVPTMFTRILKLEPERRQGTGDPSPLPAAGRHRYPERSGKRATRFTTCPVCCRPTPRSSWPAIGAWSARPSCAAWSGTATTMW
jgi:fatty-acyl-CoA synthase